MPKIVLEKLRIASPDLYDEVEAKYADESGCLRLPPEWTSKIRGERSFSQPDPEPEESSTEEIPESTKARLEAVEKFGGRSGIYSGNNDADPEDLGIQWKKRPLRTED